MLGFNPIIPCLTIYVLMVWIVYLGICQNAACPNSSWQDICPPHFPHCFSSLLSLPLLHRPSHNLSDLKGDRKIYDSCSLFSASLRIKWNSMYQTSTYFTSHYFSGQSCPSYKESHPTNIHSLFLRSCQEKSETYCQCTQCKNIESCFFFFSEKKKKSFLMLLSKSMCWWGTEDQEIWTHLVHFAIYTNGIEMRVLAPISDLLGMVILDVTPPGITAHKNGTT